MKNKALIIGASGGMGRNIIEYLSTLSEWDIVGLDINSPKYGSTQTFIQVDLLNGEEAKTKLSHLTDITHIFCVGFIGDATFSGPIEKNLSLLKNTIDAIEPIATNLQRIFLMEGGKVYGRQLGAFKTPAKETDARHMPPNFYFNQEDFLAERQKGKTWSWVALRPELLCSNIVGIPNLPLLIAVYASISKELGLPLRYPGSEGAYKALVQVCDATLLAKATVWAATSPNAANQAINFTNGDAFRWQNLWKRIAKFFEMEYEEPQKINLETFMKDKETLWNSMVEKYGLEQNSYFSVAAWQLGDFLFNCDWDTLLSTTKIQQLGFNDVADSEEMFLSLFQNFRERKIIP
jgi:nucleoside-diphosphate-sugar epimerase